MRKLVLSAAIAAAFVGASNSFAVTRSDFTDALIVPSMFANQSASPALNYSTSLSAGQATNTLFNAAGFETYTAPANLGGQNNFVIASGNATRFTVQGTTGLTATQGVRANSTVTDWAYPEVNYTPTVGEGVSVNVDISRTISGTTPSFGYGIDAYNSTGRIARWGLANSGGNVAVFVTSLWNGSAFSPTGTPANVVVSGALLQNTYYNLEGRLNLAAGTWDLYNNNTLFIGNLPLLINGTDVTDADIHVSSNAAATDQGFFDNYLVQTFNVPEPTSLAFIAIGGLMAQRRRRKA